MSDFLFDFLEWCEDIKGIKTVKETQNRDLIREFYFSEYWNQKPVNGIDYAMALGYYI